MRRDALKSLMESRGLKVADLARGSGIKATTLYSYFSGKSSSLTTKTEQDIADYLGVTIGELYKPEKPSLIPLVGKIGAGAIVYPCEGEDSVMGYVKAPPGLSPDGLIALEVDGYSMPPFKPGHKIFASTTRMTDPRDCINEMCIVQVKHGPRLFKILRKGYERGTFNLDSLDGAPPMENVEIEWAAVVEGASFT